MLKLGKELLIRWRLRPGTPHITCPTICGIGEEYASLKDTAGRERLLIGNDAGLLFINVVGGITSTTAFAGRQAQFTNHGVPACR